MPKLFPLLALILATGLIAAGCGGDDDDDGGDDDTTTEETTSGATGASGATGESDSELVSQVNEVCKDVNSEFEGPDTTPQDVVKAVNDGLDQIRAVDGAEDDAGVAAFVDAAQKDVDALEKDPKSIEDDPFAATNKAAEEAGLDDCAN